MDRKVHWEGIYTDRSPLEVSWYQSDPELSVSLIQNTGISKEASIIDVGGGASVLVDRLYASGFHNLTILDISAKALVHTRLRLGESADKIDWFESDVTDFVAPHPFDLWHDRAVFHFLTDQKDRRSYVEVLNKALRPGGHLVLAAFAIDGPEKCSGLDIVQYDAEKLSAELGEGFTLKREQTEVHITPAEKEQKFAYFWFVKET